MVSSGNSRVASTIVCQTCGDKGEMQLLIRCRQCQDSAVHHYCLDSFSPHDDQITWVCEECNPKVAKGGSSRKSERVSFRKDRAAEVRINWKKRLSKSSSSTAKRLPYSKDKPAELAQPAGERSSQYEDMQNLHSFDVTCGHQEHRKKRRLLLEDTDGREELQSVSTEASAINFKGHGSSLNMLFSQPSSPSGEYVHAQPVAEPIWRGSFIISDDSSETLMGLMAHISSKACSKVADAAISLPRVIDVCTLPRSDIWPKSFQKSSPTDESIALYFFPEYERDEPSFDGLLEKMIEHSLALKATINNVELLVFSSLELPQQHWRFRRKYYMWGVFRNKKFSGESVPANHFVSSSRSAHHVSPSMCLKESGNQCTRGSRSMSTRPQSPPSTGSSHVCSPHHRFLPKATSSSLNSLSRCTSKLSRFHEAEQGYNEAKELKVQHLRKFSADSTPASSVNSSRPNAFLFHMIEEGNSVGSCGNVCGNLYLGQATNEEDCRDGSLLSDAAKPYFMDFNLIK